jgi:hypothetical protein
VLGQLQGCRLLLDQMSRSHLASQGYGGLLSDMTVFMPTYEHQSVRTLSDAQIRQFTQDGFVRIDRTFPRKLAEEAAPSYGVTPDVIPTTLRRGRERSSGSAAITKSRS